jgi:hypothetical protein
MNYGLPPAEPAVWDEPLQKLGGSILQSRSWGQFQQALDRDSVWAQGEGWQWLANVRVSRGLRYLMCGYGPVATSSATMTTALRSLMAAATELNIDFVRVEPQAQTTPEQLLKLGARHISEVDPEHTRIITLTQSEKALRSQLASGHRNLINGTQRRGITIKQMATTTGVDILYSLLQDTARYAHVTFYPQAYYQALIDELGATASLYVAEAEGQSVAAALFYDWGGTRYYAHAGANQETNRRIKASVSLVWQAVMDAKAAQIQYFDLWGTAPEGDSTHRLAGITKFKAAFGGESVDYVGTWDIPLKHHKYRIYGVYRRLRGRS